MSNTVNTFEAAASAAASKATYTGAASAVAGWLLSNEFAVLAGLLLGFAGFIVNWYYRHKQDRRDQAEHERRMQQPPHPEHHP